jgi:hypothetical protein
MARLIDFAAIAVAVAVAAPANAAIQFFTTQSSFNAAISGAATDTFNDLSFGLGPYSLGRSIGPYGYTVSASQTLDITDVDSKNMSTAYIEDVVFDNFTGGAFAIGGEVFGSNTYGDLISPISSIVVTVTAQGGLTQTQTILNPIRTTYFGFVSSTPITALSIFGGQNNVVYATVDNLTLGSPAVSGVPEPASWAMLIAGFGLTGAAMRRRRIAVVRA